MKSESSIENRIKMRRVCWFCGEGLKTRQIWKIKVKGRKTLEGEYCSKNCCSMDIWGPKYDGAIPVTTCQ